MKYIFITGMGRSGTTFLGDLLNNIANADAHHKYMGNREFWLLSWYLGRDYSLSHLQRDKVEIESKHSNDFFIDVNGYLQNATSELSEVFNPEKTYHLVRDPRKVIRSLYMRRNDKNIHLVPKNAKDIEKWHDGDKFWQICWNWAATSKQLLSQKTDLIRFEGLVGDYSYFEEKMLEPFGFKLPYDLWDTHVNKPKNKTQSRMHRYLYALVKRKEFVTETLPVFDQWTKEQKQVFEDVCGETMTSLGYEL